MRELMEHGGIVKLNGKTYSKNDVEKVRFLIENDLVDTIDLGRALLADPAFSKAVLEGTEYKKCFECKSCQYGPGMPHKCPRGSI